MKTNDTFIEKTGEIVNLITKYGTHNFNLTRILLDSLEEKIKPTTERHGMSLTNEDK